jgi:ferrous iron transport protein B
MPQPHAETVPAVATAPRPSGRPVPLPRVALVGNPNTGKTTVFNRLCGTRAKTSNFPGTTTTSRTGRATLPGGTLVEIVDLPGLYAVSLDSPESAIVRDVLQGTGLFRRPDAVIVVLDACNLTRNLMLAGELRTYDVPMIVALNMVDLAQRRGLTLDPQRLADRLGCAVVPTVARRGTGLDDVMAAVADVVPPRPGAPYVAAATPADLPPRGSDGNVLAAWADDVLAASAGMMHDHASVDPTAERLDRILTHPVSGLLAFVVVMGLLFWTLFALATIPMDLIEATFGSLGQVAETYLPEGPIRDLTINGIIGGIAGTVVFLPQICLLFFFISLLEDTGYLARAAFVMDRVLHRFGLPGQAFVPLLTASACALPGIMATRLIPDRRDRLATIMVAPLVSCSARLPVYVLLTSLLFAGRPGLAALAFGACYLLGALAALGSATVFSRTLLRGQARPMVLELPSYKTPSLTNALLTARDQGLAFLKTAGTVIMAICIVMWWLGSYPSVPPTPEAEALRARAEAMTATPEAQQELLDEADAVQARAAQAGSFAGMFGRAIQPVFAPLGFDWQLTVGVLTSFLAREVFVSTLSVLVGAGGDGDVDEGVIQRIRQATRDDGRPMLTPAVSASALVFFVLAMQCLPTLAVTRRETGRLSYAALQLGYMSVLAYVVAFVVYQGLRAGGVQ